MSAETITPLLAVQNLTQISRDLDAAGYKLAQAERRSVEKREAHTLAWAKAYLSTGGEDSRGKPFPVATREAKATIATADTRIAAEAAEAEVRIVRSDIRILERRIDVGRSTVGVLRAEAQL